MSSRSQGVTVDRLSPPCQADTVAVRPRPEADDAGSRGTAGPGSGGPRWLAAAIVLVEAAAFLALTGGEVVALVRDGAAAAAPPAVFFAACALGLAWCARGLVQRESWSRGPLLAAQLLLLALAWSYRQPYPVLAVAVATAAVLTLALLVLPSTTRALAEPRGDEAT